MNPNCMKTLTMYQISLFYENHFENNLEKGESVVSAEVSGILFARFPTVECISKGFSFLL